MARELIYRLMPNRINRLAGPEKLAPEDARLLRWADVVGEPGRVKRCRGLARGQVTKSASTITAAGMFERQDCRKVFIDASAAGNVRITPGVIAACVGPLPEWQDNASPLDAQTPVPVLPWPAGGLPCPYTAVWCTARWNNFIAGGYRLSCRLNPGVLNTDYSRGVGILGNAGSAYLCTREKYEDSNIGCWLTAHSDTEISGYLPMCAGWPAALQALAVSGIQWFVLKNNGGTVEGPPAYDNPQITLSYRYARPLSNPAAGGTGYEYATVLTYNGITVNCY